MNGRHFLADVKDIGMPRRGTVVALCLPQDARAAVAIGGPIRGKTAHKKIPKLANDRDTNVIGAATHRGTAGSAFDAENQSLPGADDVPSAHSVDRGRAVQSIPTINRNGGLFSAMVGGHLAVGCNGQFYLFQDGHNCLQKITL